MWHSDKCKLRPACGASLEAYTLQMMFGQHRIVKRLAKALIRLRVYVQADLRLCWSHIPHSWKSHVASHMLLVELSNCMTFS